MPDIVTQREMDRILEIADGLGIHRERIVVPLAPRHPGRVRPLPGGRIEVVVERDDYDAWLAGLPAALRTAAAG